MHLDRNHPTIRPILALLALFCSLPPSAGGQVHVPTNQIRGTIELTSSAEIEEILLAAGGLRSGVLRADSLAVSPPLNSTTALPPSPSLSIPYEISVEAGDAGSGQIEYNVWVELGLGADQDRYRFATRTSAPVEEEPAPDVPLDFHDCVALVEVTWENPADAPVTAGSFSVFREITPGSGSLEFLAADHGIAPNSTRERLAVRGDDGAGREYTAFITLALGSDDFSDRLHFPQEKTFRASCGEIVEIVADVPRAGKLGEIVGTVDMLDEVENPVSNRTLVVADSGPFGNFRFDSLATSDPSRGPFRLRNLLPSDLTSPASGYRIWANMSLRRDRRTQVFWTPFLNGAERVVVPAEQTLDLGDTFVIDPGWIDGELFLAGPPPGDAEPCLADVFRASDRDSDGDGIPDGWTLSDSSAVRSSGRNVLATGASKTARNGLGAALFEGEYETDPSFEAFVGDYELALGGLHGESTIWSSPQLTLRFRDGAPEPGSHQNSRVTLTDQGAADLEIVPGTARTVDLRRCFGQLNLGFVGTSTRFYAPQISGIGRLTGVDFESQPADQEFTFWAHGTPLNESSATLEGLVVACLPEGTYDFTPFVASINPNGTVSSTELKEVRGVEIECRQVKNLVSGLQVNLDLPLCSDGPVASLGGAAVGTGDLPVEVVEVSYTINGEPAVPVCGSAADPPSTCGEDPAFGLDVPLQACSNQVEVTARDAFGNTASTRASVRFDHRAPALHGCRDVELEDLATGSAVVDVDVTSSDDCGGLPPVTCDLPPDSVFPQGVTEVTCSASDVCGNTSTCSFTVGPPAAVLSIQDLDGRLLEIDAAGTPALSEALCAPFGTELNNAGIRRGDGKVYALELTTFPSGNRGVVRLDPDACTLEHLGPAGLPANQRFDAGDVSTDGRTLFVNRAGLNPLYKVDLDAHPLTAVRVDMTGARGYVHDWAYRSQDGLLYGGDSLDGQLAVLDPDTGFRRDLALAGEGWGGLPAGTAYGGAWFDALGRLVLHRNDGTIYVVDVDVPAIVEVSSGPASTRNDAAGRRPRTP